jgi:hypothetical protein
MWPKDNNKQVSAAVRILQQKRDASARATHLMVKNDSLITYEKAFEGQAAVKKFFIATFLERKKMSTKTITKRIALVAVAALAIGGFSAVSANATTYPTAAAATGGTAFGGSATARTVTATVGAYVTDVVTSGTADKVYTISSTGVGTLSIAPVSTTGGETIYPALDDDSGATGKYTIKSPTSASWYTGNAEGLGAAFGGTETFTFAAYSDVAGTQTVSIKGNSTATATTVTITWGAAPAVSASYSTSVISPLNTAAVRTTDAAVVYTKGDGVTSTQAGTIEVSLLSGFETAITKGLSATITGPGSLSLTSVADFTTAGDFDNAPTGRSIAIADSAATGSQYVVAIWNDGEAGVSTITLKSGTTVVGTETVTFYGSVAKVTATQVYSIADASGVNALGNDNTDGALQDSAVIVKLTDANGNAVVATPSIKSNDTSVIVGLDSACDADAAVPGTYYCDIDPAANDSGKSATVYFYVTVNSVDIKSDLLTFKLGGAVKTVTAALDAASYDPGTAVALNFTAKDSKGNPVFDGARADFLNGGVVFNYGTGVSTTSNEYSFVGGVATLKTYAPLAAGNLVAKGKYGTDAGSTLVGTTFALEATVNGDASSSLALDAANAATDAANNAYDEAQNATQAASDALAAVTALAAQVKSLIASVKKLTAAVAKLKK